MVKNGIDCASKITKQVAEKLVASGQTFVARYLVPAKYEWKRISPEEAQILSDSGMDILSVFESTANRALDGLSGGKADALLAFEEASIVGQPKGSAIYFAVDFDVTKPIQYDIIEQYLLGAGSILGDDYHVGLYAEYSVIEEMGKRGACKHFWQTYAWSQGKLSKLANVYQFRNGQQMAGITVDMNNSFGNEGFWNLRNAKLAIPPITKFPDVPGGHWAEQAIYKANKAGIMVGNPDGTFGLGKALTREEAASIVAKLLRREVE